MTLTLYRVSQILKIFVQAGYKRLQSEHGRIFMTFTQIGHNYGKEDLYENFFNLHWHLFGNVHVCQPTRFKVPPGRLQVGVLSAIQSTKELPGLTQCHLTYFGVLDTWGGPQRPTPLSQELMHVFNSFFRTIMEIFTNKKYNIKY